MKWYSWEFFAFFAVNICPPNKSKRPNQLYTHKHTLNLVVVNAEQVDQLVAVSQLAKWMVHSRTLGHGLIQEREIEKKKRWCLLPFYWSHWRTFPICWFNSADIFYSLPVLSLLRRTENIFYSIVLLVILAIAIQEVIHISFNCY